MTSNRNLCKTSLCALIALSLTGCVFDETEHAEQIAQTEHELTNASSATPWQWRRAALLTMWGNRGSAYCTGTLISRRHVLTAAHCRPAPGEIALFYTSSSTADEASDRVISQVFYPTGVDPSTSDLTDSNGKFADMAVVVLGADAPAGTEPATMAWMYPSGGDDYGILVGAGRHDGNVSLRGVLRSIGDFTYSDNDRDGHFLTENEQANPGDSGGPFYYRSQVLGVMYGKVFEWEYRNKFASTPFRLSWVLGRMGYRWTGGAQVLGRRSGTTVQAFGGAVSECQYACERTSSCVAFNYFTQYGQCSLLSTVGTLYSDSRYVSATK